MTKMDKYTIFRQFGIDAGHRLLDHEGKCRHVHGHRYTFLIYFQGSDLDRLGRVVDFGEVKNKIGSWLESNWDHGMLMHEDDPITRLYKYPGDVKVYTQYKEDGNAKGDTCTTFPNPFRDMKHFILPCNPTAEHLSSYLKRVSNELMHDKEITIPKVICWETPNCGAIVE